MDIEGAEFDVLEKMIKDGSIFYINESLIEFHQKKLSDPLIMERYNKIIKFFEDNNLKLRKHG